MDLSGLQYVGLSPKARAAIKLAEEEAKRLNHNYIGTEHLLLGLLRDNELVTAKVLGILRLTLEKARSAIEFICGHGDPVVTGDIGFTARTKKCLELAEEASRELGDTYVGTAHLLLGLIKDGEGIAAGVLESSGIRLEQAREAILQARSAPAAKAEKSEAELERQIRNQETDETYKAVIGRLLQDPEASRLLAKLLEPEITKLQRESTAEQ